MKKSLFTLSVLSILSLGLAACNNGGSSSTPSSEQSSEPSSESSGESSSSESSSSEEEPKATFDVTATITQVKNQPKARIDFSTNKSLKEIEVSVSYGKEEKIQTFDIGGAQSGYITVDGFFGKNNKFELVGRTNDEFSNTVSENVSLFADEYNIAPLIATVPVTVFTLGLKNYSDSYNIPTLYYLERGASWNQSYLPVNTYPMPIFSVREHEDGELNGYEDKVFNYIKELHEINEDSVFHYFINDMWPDSWFKNQFLLGLDKDHYDVTLLSDGSWSYSWFNELFNNTQGMDKKAELETLWDTVKSNMKSQHKFDKAWLGDYEGRDMLFAWLYDDELDINWVINRVDTIGQDNLDIKDCITTLYNGGSGTKLKRYFLDQLYNNLTEAEKDSVKKLYNLGGSLFDKAIEEGKTPMIWLGTYPEVYLEEFMTATKAFLGDSYEYYYKGHPRYPTEATGGKKEKIDRAGFTEIPAAIPAELFYYFYPTVNYSGYESSTFINVGDAPSRLICNRTYEAASDEYKAVVETYISKLEASDPTYGNLVPTSEEDIFLVQEKGNYDSVNTRFSKVKTFDFSGKAFASYTYDEGSGEYIVEE